MPQKIIQQKKYGNIEIDNTEKDHVQIWCHSTMGESEVVHIERSTLDKVIEQLVLCKKSKSNFQSVNSADPV